ncbi:hypothetical protein [Methanomethylovorans sp.]|uniref:hypothetical protein n=1 Tax=Methanomethylovorans sp. TaxID=2758717 RepID=UPI003D09DEE1
MDPTCTQPIIEMGVSLAELAVKGTASAVNKKIRAAKEEKNIENLRTTYDELINEVLLEREEAVRIAQAYKSELDRIVISDDDIEHLHNTVAMVLEIFNSSQMTTAMAQGEEATKKAQDTANSLSQIKCLISVDTLKTMQLLGFNYKAAIGEPLTQICADAISAWGSKKSPMQNSQRKK